MRRALLLIVGFLFIGGTVAAFAPSSDAGSVRLNQMRPLGSVCKFSHRANDDPIVHPNGVGMSHSHDFFGNVTTDAMSTKSSLSAAASTCHYGVDRAAYWLPTLYANGEAMAPHRTHAYYSRKTFDPVVPPPNDLRIIAGGTRSTIVFSCMRNKMPTVQRMRPTDCAAGGDLSIGIRFPDCWNGTDLDSTDHRSHMAYSQDGFCPDTHPVAVARLLLFAVYPDVPDGATLTLASGGLETAHADFVNAWDQRFLSKTLEFCVNRSHNCQKQLPVWMRPSAQIQTFPDLYGAPT